MKTQKQRKRWMDRLDAIATGISIERTGGRCEVRLSDLCHKQGGEVHHGAGKHSIAQRYFLKAHVYTCRFCHTLLGDNTKLNENFMISKIGLGAWEEAKFLANDTSMSLETAERMLKEWQKKVQ